MTDNFEIFKNVSCRLFRLFPGESGVVFMNIVEAKYGKMYVIESDNVVSRALSMYGEWAEDELNLLKDLISPGMCILDIGAFIGTHTLAFSALTGATGRVFSFEPRKEIYEVLVKNIELNGLENVTELNVGVSDQEKKLLLPRVDINKDLNFGALNLNYEANKDGQDRYEIELVLIDDLKLFDAVDIIKIDVEGMERKVLDGALKTISKDRPIVFCECNSLNSGLDILNYCSQVDYIVFGFLAAAYNPGNFKSEDKNIFGSASELNLLLIPNESGKIVTKCNLSNRLVPIISPEDLVLPLMHKPQYPYEVLSGTSASLLMGINFPSPLTSQVIAESERKVGQLNKIITERDEQLINFLNSRSWRLTAPLRHISELMRIAFFKIKTTDFGFRNKTSCPVDIIVPVYKGLSETKACLQSIWQSTPAHPYRLIVINDCSPELEVTKWLRQASKTKPMVLIENEVNLGFVGSVNVGMRLSKTADVLLLNSDTEVANDWLDRLVAHAYSNPINFKPVATVTPFSNNATICSYPVFCRDNNIPHGFGVSDLDYIFSITNKSIRVDIPTAVGFCMYIRRDALIDVGFFDEENFGKGYGEENDFSVRAIEKGWRNVHALDTFVWHKGSVSFGDSQPKRVIDALEVLNNIHPQYISLIHTFSKQDPARLARNKVDLVRLQKSQKPIVLLINHQRGGGTERHCEELRDYLPEIEWLMLKPYIDGRVVLSWYAKDEVLSFNFHLVDDWGALIKTLLFLRVQRIHFHHWLGFDPVIFNLSKALSVPQDFTFHDYYSVCPQITLTDKSDIYCGEKGVAQCTQCLKSRPAENKATIIHWRNFSSSFLANCDRIIFPAFDVFNRVLKYFPDLIKENSSNIIVSSHPDSEVRKYPEPILKIRDDGVIRIAIIGALSRIKGADVLEAVAVEAHKKGLPLEFKHFGFSYRSLIKTPNLSVTGQYKDAELQEMLLNWEPTLAWFPAQWPETYSYTLSACLELGLPVVSSSLGAIPERIDGRLYSWTLDWKTTPIEWCQWFSRLSHEGVEIPSDTKSLVQTTDSCVQFGFYSSHYISGLNFDIPRKEIALDFLVNILDYISTKTEVEEGFRLRLISMLYWLRAQPLLRWLSRKIPSAFQRRIKSAILGERF